MAVIFRELLAGVKQQWRNTEWTCEGSLKGSFRVGADGNLNRYQPGRYVDRNDTKYLKEWVNEPKGHAPIWVVPQKLWMYNDSKFKAFVPVIVTEAEAFFITK